MPRYQPARIREIRLHRRKKTATCSTYRAHGKVKPRKVSDISPLSRIDAEPRWIFGAVSPTAVSDDDPAATDAERRVVAAAAVTAPADTINPAAVAAVAEVGIDITGQTRKSSPPTPRPSWSPWAAATPALLPRNLLPRLETRRPPRTRHRRGPPHPRPDRSPHPRPAHRTSDSIPDDPGRRAARTHQPP